MDTGRNIWRHNLKRLPPSDGGAVYLSYSCPADIYPSARYFALACICRAIDSKIGNLCLMSMGGYFRRGKGMIFLASRGSKIRGGSDWQSTGPHMSHHSDVGGHDTKRLTAPACRRCRPFEAVRIGCPARVAPRPACPCILRIGPYITVGMVSQIGNLQRLF